MTRKKMTTLVFVSFPPSSPFPGTPFSPLPPFSFFFPLSMAEKVREREPIFYPLSSFPPIPPPSSLLFFFLSNPPRMEIEIPFSILFLFFFSPSRRSRPFGFLFFLLDSCRDVSRGDLSHLFPSPPSPCPSSLIFPPPPLVANAGDQERGQLSAGLFPPPFPPLFRCALSSDFSLRGGCNLSYKISFSPPAPSPSSPFSPSLRLSSSSNFFLSFPYSPLSAVTKRGKGNNDFLFFSTHFFLFSLLLSNHFPEFPFFLFFPPCMAPSEGLWGERTLLSMLPFLFLLPSPSPLPRLFITFSLLLPPFPRAQSTARSKDKGTPTVFLFSFPSSLSPNLLLCLPPDSLLFFFSSPPGPQR